MTITKEGFDRRWQKIPKRKSRQWYILMHEIMKNFRKVFINVELSNPDFSGLSYSTKSLLKKVRENPNKDFLSFVYTYGIGKVLYELQPWLLPWVRISKAKVSKEFRVFLLEAKQRRQAHQRTKSLMLPWLDLYSDARWGSHVKYLSIVGWHPRSNISPPPLKKTLVGAVAHKLKSRMYSNDECNIALCRDINGKTVLGVVPTYYLSMRGRTWLLEGRIEVSKEGTSLMAVPLQSSILQKGRLWALISADPSVASLTPILCERHE